MSEPLPIARGLAGRCPRCGKGKLFAGFLSLRPACESCGLEFDFADAGDGPAVFVILIGGAIVVFAALMTAILKALNASSRKLRRRFSPNTPKLRCTARSAVLLKQ